MAAEPYALVLGVAQDGGHPQPGCRRDCCVGPEVSPHLTTCVAVIDEGRFWLLDAGPDLPRHLARINTLGVELAGVLLTHGHIGHYAGLAFLGREAMNATRLPVWAAPRMSAFLAANVPWSRLITAGNIEVRRLDGPISLGARVQAEAFPVPHRDEYSETVGWRVTGSRRSLLYVPDTDGWDGWESPIEEYLATVDRALLDGTFFSRNELDHRDQAAIAHPTVTESLLRFVALDDTERSKILFTHLNHTNPLLRPDSDEYIRVFRSGMEVATEGDIFEL